LEARTSVYRPLSNDFCGEIFIFLIYNSTPVVLKLLTRDVIEDVLSFQVEQVKIANIFLEPKAVRNHLAKFLRDEHQLVQVAKFADFASLKRF
jgi:hypothetical protein